MVLLTDNYTYCTEGSYSDAAGNSSLLGCKRLHLYRQGINVCLSVDTDTRVLRNVGDYLCAENCSLLGYYAVSSGNFLPRRLNYKCSLCKNPGERRYQPLRGGRLQSHIYEVPGKFSVTPGAIQRKETKQFSELQGFTSQQTALFISTVVRTANVTNIQNCWYF